MSNTAADVMRIAIGELGYSRWNDPQTGTKYGRWYAAYTGNSWYGDNGVPYCAMFVSWCMNQAGATAPGIPGAYCPWILDAGKASGKMVPVSQAKYGDLVLFDWEGDGVSDHIGFVEKNTGTSLQCVEGNTNNGAVARRSRAYSTVIGVIRPDYSGTPSTSTPPSSGGSSSTDSIAVDGLWGPATTRALQKVLGTPVDGIVSDQWTAYRASNPGLISSSWEWHNPARKGSVVIKAMQGKIGATADGFGGPETFKALQKYLGTPVDGRIDYPSVVVKALQKKLNSGSF